MPGPCNTDPQEWLLGEGLIPLLGASVFYIAVRCSAWITANPKQGFKFYLSEALDPLGWLYGGAVLAFETWMKREGHGIFTWALFTEGVICLLLLMTAMMNKAESKRNNVEYKAPPSAEWAAGVLVTAILYTGFRAYH